MESGLVFIRGPITAQAFTWQALQQGYRPGLGQHLPKRRYVTAQED